MPAAITITSASFGPIDGTGTCSIANACFGSPKRSRRITCAYIRSGTSPMGGISPSSYTCFVPVVTTVLLANLRFTPAAWR